MINSTQTNSFKTIMNLETRFITEANELLQAYLEERYGFYDDKDRNLVCSELTKAILEPSNIKICLNEQSGVLFVGSLDEPLDAVLRISEHNCLEPYITCPECFNSGFLDDFLVERDSEDELVLKCPTLKCENIIMKF